MLNISKCVEVQQTLRFATLWLSVMLEVFIYLPSLLSLPQAGTRSEWGGSEPS